MGHDDPTARDLTGRDDVPDQKVVYGGEIQKGGGMVDPKPHVVTDDEDPEGLDPEEPEKDWTR